VIRVCVPALLVIAFSAGLVGQRAGPVTMLFAGDVTLAQHIEREVGERVDYVFEHWNQIGAYDIFMVNLENPITRSTAKVEKEFNFRMPARYIKTLQGAGINVVNLANNHVGDYGLQGLYDTIANLDSAGIRYVGAGRDLDQARTPLIIELRGKRIGLLGYYGSGTWAATRSRPGVAPRHEPSIISDVQKLRATVNYLVVSFHWGEESADRPSPEQIRLAHRVIDAGADLIVGHHSHTLQGIERYKGKVIAYSLGNFVFGGNRCRSYGTAVLRVVLGEASQEVELVPVQVINWQPRVAERSTADVIIKRVRDRSAIFSESISFSSGATE